MDLFLIVIYISIYFGLFALTLYLLSLLERKKIKPKTKKLFYVSIIIPAYNEEKNLEKTLEYAAKLDYPKNKFEIIVVDDGSKDKTYEIAKKLEKKYQNVRAFKKENEGKAAALNFGIKKSNGNIIITLDADSFVEKNALIKMMPYFNEEKVVAVVPAIKVYKPKGVLQRLQAIEYDLGIFMREVFSKINAIHVVPGPFSAYKKEFFLKHGYFDEKNITEDLEIALRIQSENYKIENCHEAIVYTIAPKNIKTLTRQRKRWYFGMIKNMLNYKFLFGKKYGEFGAFILPIAIISIFFVMITTLYYTIKNILSTIENFDDYSRIGFDFTNAFEFKIEFLKIALYRAITNSITLFAAFFILVTLAIILLTNKKIKSNEKAMPIFISFLFFLPLYGLLYTIWWIISIIQSIISKDIKW